MFTSPHMKRAFKVVVANTISSVTWVIDFYMREVAPSEVTLNYKLQFSHGTNNRFSVYDKSYTVEAKST